MGDAGGSSNWQRSVGRGGVVGRGEGGKGRGEGRRELQLAYSGVYSLEVNTVVRTGFARNRPTKNNNRVFLERRYLAVLHSNYYSCVWIDLQFYANSELNSAIASRSSSSHWWHQQPAWLPSTVLSGVQYLNPVCLQYPYLVQYLNPVCLCL